MRARKEAGKESAITVVERLGLPKKEEHLQQILQSFERELRWAAQLPDPTPDPDEAPEDTRGEGSGGGPGGAGPAVNNVPEEAESIESAPAPPPPPPFEEVDIEEARRRLRGSGGKIYGCTSPPDARGVWVGRWLAVLAVCPDLVGQSCKNLDEAGRSFARDRDPVRIRLAP